MNIGTVIDGTWKVSKVSKGYLALENVSGSALTNIWLEDGGDHDGYKMHARWPSSPGLLFGVHQVSGGSGHSNNQVKTPGQFILSWSGPKGKQRAKFTY